MLSSCTVPSECRRIFCRERTGAGCSMGRPGTISTVDIDCPPVEKKLASEATETSLATLSPVLTRPRMGPSSLPPALPRLIASNTESPVMYCEPPRCTRCVVFGGMTSEYLRVAAF